MCINRHDGGQMLPMSDTRDSSFDPRRRSVDVGGLALALGTSSLGETRVEMGKGWGGWEESEHSGAMYAELLSDMYTQTQTAVNQPILLPFPVVPDHTRTQLIDKLDNWHFEPHKLSDDEVISCTLILFEALLRVEGMQEAVGVSLDQLGSFLIHLRQAYRATNNYHNFHHALDVFQATHMYLRSAGAVPPVGILHFSSDSPRGTWRQHAELRSTWIGLLRLDDIFASYIAAVGHDVGHPGFNNIFMKNAQAPLSQVYDHKSALEHMHCAFLLPIMKHHGLGHLLNPSPSGGQSDFRRLLLDTVLATDMGVHKTFMDRFGRLMEHPDEFGIQEARTLICQAIVKCADISNPSRPHTVSHYWSSALAAEWANQALLERQLCLPVSVQDSDDPITEAKGQVSFISFCVAPLLEITSKAIPEMKAFVDQCTINCSSWKIRLAELEGKETNDGRNYPPEPYRSISPSQSHDFHTVFPLSLPPHFYNSSYTPSQFSNSDSTSKTTRSDLDTVDGDSCMSDGASVNGLPGNGNCGSERYTDVGTTSSSRSTSPISLSSGTPFLSPTFNIQSNVTNASGRPNSVSPFDTSSEPESISEGVSPRSEFTPRTPGSSIGVPMHETSPFQSSTTLLTGSTASMSALGPGTGANEVSSIRAAYKLSVRKKRSFHRNSWTPSLASSTKEHQPPVPSTLSITTMRSLFNQKFSVDGSPSASFSRTPTPSQSSPLNRERSSTYMSCPETRTPGADIASDFKAEREEVDLDGKSKS